MNKKIKGISFSSEFEFLSGLNSFDFEIIEAKTMSVHVPSRREFNAIGVALIASGAVVLIIGLFLSLGIPDLDFGTVSEMQGTCILMIAAGAGLVLVGTVFFTNKAYAHFLKVKQHSLKRMIEQNEAWLKENRKSEKPVEQVERLIEASKEKLERITEMIDNLADV